MLILPNSTKEIYMLVLRRYKAEDNEAVKALHYAGIKQFDADAGTDADLFGVGVNIDADLDDVENVYIKNNGEFLVGIREEKIVAMGALKKLSTTCAEIKRMRVYPEYQRQGLGQIILLELLAVAAQLGYTELCLDTVIQNVPAQKLYEKHGFVRTSQKKMGRFDLLLYEKQLNG